MSVNRYNYINESISMVLSKLTPVSSWNIDYQFVILVLLLQCLAAIDGSSVAQENAMREKAKPSVCPCYITGYRLILQYKICSVILVCLSVCRKEY